MEETSKNMEELILQKAEVIFLEKGFAAASTSEIARVAGCNQALVHYYFRTKEKLFTAVFENKFKIFAASLLPFFFRQDQPFLEKIREFISQHFEFLQANPSLPRFLINELNSNEIRREMIIDRFKVLSGELYPELQKEMDQEHAAGRIAEIRVIDLLLDIVLLNVSVFTTKPLAAELYAHLSGDNDYLESRKKENIELITRRLTCRE